MEKKIIVLMEQYTKELTKAEEGNKSAGKRARKFSLELDKLNKEFRKYSVTKEKA